MISVEGWCFYVCASEFVVSFYRILTEWVYHLNQKTPRYCKYTQTLRIVSEHDVCNPHALCVRMPVHVNVLTDPEMHLWLDGFSWIGFETYRSSGKALFKSELWILKMSNTAILHYTYCTKIHVSKHSWECWLVAIGQHGICARRNPQKSADCWACHSVYLCKYV